MVVVQHVGQDILGVLQSLGHLSVIAIQGLVQWHGRPLTLFVDVSDISIFRVQQNLSVVLKVYLYNFVAEAEHDGVLRSHPLLDVD